jgi:MFS family permease
VFLLTPALLINYIDRGNLATAGPLLLNELKLSPTQLGTLLSAFYIAYAAAMVPAGWLADRFGAKMVLGIGVAIWSVATFMTGFVNSFASLRVRRLLLGLGESPIMPGTSKLIRRSLDRSMYACRRFIEWRAEMADGVRVPLESCRHGWHGAAPA